MLTNVFCGQLLGRESIINMFLDNFIVYGWDLTDEHNKNLYEFFLIFVQKIVRLIFFFRFLFRFLTSISLCVSQSAATTVRSIPVEHMPTILIVAKVRSQCDVFSVIHGEFFFLNF